MNILGAIGTLMDGSGIKDSLETIYGENAVQHIMTEKQFSGPNVTSSPRSVHCTKSFEQSNI